MGKKNINVLNYSNDFSLKDTPGIEYNFGYKILDETIQSANLVPDLILSDVF